MTRADDNVQGDEGGGRADRRTPLNPDQLDLQYKPPEMEITYISGGNCWNRSK